MASTIYRKNDMVFINIFLDNPLFLKDMLNNKKTAKKLTVFKYLYRCIIIF